MPSAQALAEFIALVESNDHVGALQRFYATHATMQDNEGPPRVGLAAHVAHEQAIMARAKGIESRCIRPVFVDGDTVVIRWVFDFAWLDGTRTHMEEVAWQLWEDGKVVREKFFFDPAQRTPVRRRTAPLLATELPPPA